MFTIKILRLQPDETYKFEPVVGGPYPDLATCRIWMAKLLAETGSVYRAFPLDE